LIYIFDQPILTAITKKEIKIVKYKNKLFFSVIFRKNFLQYCA